MAEHPAAAASHEVICPHCKKPFEAELITGDAPRYEGFKCPHCKLFTPAERMTGDDPPSAA